MDKKMVGYDEKYSKNTLGFNRHFPRQIRFLLRWVGCISNNLKILDLGGGTGEYSIMLQEMGHEVTCYDYSQIAIESAKNLGVRKTICSDFLSSPPNEKFDLVLVKGFSLLNTDNALDFKNIMHNIFKVLTPHGTVLY